MGRAYGSHDYFLLQFNGLKSVVTILAEAMPLIPYSFKLKCNLRFHSCENTTLNDVHSLNKFGKTKKKGKFYRFVGPV